MLYRKKTAIDTHLTYKDFHQNYFYCILTTACFSPNFDYSMEFINITWLLKQQCSFIYCSTVEHLSYKPSTSLIFSHCSRLGNKHNFGHKTSIFTTQNVSPHELSRWHALSTTCTVILASSEGHWTWKEHADALNRLEHWASHTAGLRLMLCHQTAGNCNKRRTQRRSSY